MGAKDAAVRQTYIQRDVLVLGLDALATADCALTVR
jgi:hypothetical protein